jgi:RNA polymerase sigma-70 factor (ECF subfamily)
MITRLLFPFLFFSILLSISLSGGEKIGVDLMPPVVINTVPQSGDTGVDPSKTSIKVTFSKRMKTNNMWSWVKVSDETFPEITGKIQYLADEKTCILPVKLEPGKTYIIWINSKKYNSFRDKNNTPAVPYLLVFETKK